MPICSNHSAVETELACSSCGRPMCNECLTSLEAEEGMLPLLLCLGCLEKFRYAARRAAEAEMQDVNWAGAALWGLLAGVAGALVWYEVVRIAGTKWSLVAILLGPGVGYAVVWGAGRKRGLGLQAMAGLMTLSSLFLGEYLILDFFEKQFLALQGRSLDTPFIPVEFLFQHLQQLSFRTWAPIAAAAFLAFLIPSVRSVRGG